MEPDEAALRLEPLLDRHLSGKRARHSRSVADYAARLCSLHAIDPLRGRVAGLAHDLCKEMSYGDQDSYARTYEEESGRPSARSELLGKAILHGPASAGFLVRELGFREPDILEAIALHTIGDRRMGSLAQIVYSADKLELGRRNVDPAFRERCEILPPAELFIAVMSDSIEWMRARGLPVAEETLWLYNGLSRKESRA
jgi:nicotinate-nucleotide adenylyltransferase